MSDTSDNRPYAVIAGLGATGLSAARYLHAHGWRLAVTDTRESPPQLAALTALDARIPVRLGGLDATLLPGAVCIVASPGLPLAGGFFAEAERRGLTVVGDVELFARAAAQSRKPHYLLHSRPGVMDRALVAQLREHGIAVVSGLREGLSAIDCLARLTSRPNS